MVLAPVQHGEAHDVDEEIAHGNDPDRRVQEDLAAQERLVFGFFLGLGMRFGVGRGRLAGLPAASGSPT